MVIIWLIIPSPVHTKHPHCMVPMECGNSRQKKHGFVEGVWNVWTGDGIIHDSTSWCRWWIYGDSIAILPPRGGVVLSMDKDGGEAQHHIHDILIDDATWTMVDFPAKKMFEYGPRLAINYANVVDLTTNDDKHCTVYLSKTRPFTCWKKKLARKLWTTWGNRGNLWGIYPILGRWSKHNDSMDCGGFWAKHGHNLGLSVQPFQQILTIFGGLNRFCFSGGVMSR